MPLDACPRCGYALSMLDHHCRHCPPAPLTGPAMRFDLKHLPQIVLASVGLGLLVYFIFRHVFG
jgi:hypothetical protein